NPDALSRPCIGHPRYPAGNAKRAALDNQVIDAAEDAEPITEGDVGIRDAADIAGLFLDADDLRHANQFFQDIGGNIDTVSDRVVVDHDRQLAGAGDLAVPVRRL